MRSIVPKIIPNKFLADQLRQPSGLFGKFFMGDFLNKGNEKINHLTVELLDVKPTDRVLDIGFGGGVTIEEMLKTIDTGKIHGVDFSQAMVDKAKRRFKKSIQAGKVSIEFGDVGQLPFEAKIFDKVCTVNTIYFWKDPLVSLREIRRVLKKGGKLIISIRSADKMKDLPFTQHDFKLYAPEDIKHLLVGAGFNNISIDHRDRDEKFDSVMIIADV
ncbi:class I SAM-dependent methyltransferase [Chamaesiphon sp. OTE_75_metabat_556]|uniref:class I SAM-dependent methyltransferase n=1 Tax=Chamaesiphon sp. OTE_75_metabat_556 TaxID=2964692 RepID=UPI00286A15F0|nr:class I SAM-dependent methyltransferase [Chamaesiphon sp. OTE_75_metabat_556]